MRLLCSQQLRQGQLCTWCRPVRSLRRVAAYARWVATAISLSSYQLCARSHAIRASAPAHAPKVLQRSHISQAKRMRAPAVTPLAIRRGATASLRHRSTSALPCCSLPHSAASARPPCAHCSTRQRQPRAERSTQAAPPHLPLGYFPTWIESYGRPHRHSSCAFAVSGAPKRCAPAPAAAAAALQPTPAPLVPERTTRALQHITLSQGPHRAIPITA